MRAPKVTLYALIAIAAWDSLAAISQAQEPSSPSAHPGANKANRKANALSAGRATAAVTTAWPETLARYTFSAQKLAGSQGLLVNAANLPSLDTSLAELKQRLRDSFKSPNPFTSQPNKAAAVTGHTAQTPNVGPEKTAHDRSDKALTGASPEAGSASRTPAAPTQADVAQAAASLALQLADAGQADRARRMAELVAPEQQPQVLEEIEAKLAAQAPPQPLVAPPGETGNSAETGPAEPGNTADAPPQPLALTFPDVAQPAPAAPDAAESNAAPSSETEPQALAAAQPSLLEPAAVAPSLLNPEPAPVTPELPALPESLAYLGQPPGQSASGMILPLAGGAPVTSSFGWRTHPISGQQRFHSGTDFGAPEGTPVLAALPGKVTRADWTGGYGLAVEIEHQDGAIDTFYAHLSQVLVNAGDWVERGTAIGHVGSTGYSTGPHLHFEVRRRTADGMTAVDPIAELGNAPALASPTEATVSQLPTLKTGAIAVADPAPSSRPVPEYAVYNLNELKVAAQPASAATAGPKQSLPAPPQLPSISLPAGAPAQPTLPALPTVDTPAVPALPAAEAAQLPAQDRFNNLKIEDFGYWSDLCQSLVSSGQFTEAVAACDRTIALKPDETNAWLLRGQALEGLKQYTEAIANYGYVLHREPKHAEALTYQCRAFLQLGSADSALEACDQALSANRFWGQTSPADAWHLRGQALAQQTNYEDALQAYSRSLKEQGDRSDVILDRGRALLALGRYEDVITTGDEALAIDKNWGDSSPAQALQLQGQALAEMGRSQDAIALLDQALSRDLKDADIWATQGQLLLDQGRYGDALNSFQQAVQIRPDFSRALIGQAAAMNELQQYETALQSIDQALQGDVAWGDITAGLIWDQRAQALGGLGQYDEALAAANRATGLQPTYAKAWNNRAVILWHLKQYDEAITSTKRAIVLEPDYAQAWFNQGRVYSTIENYGQALTAYDEVLRLEGNQGTANLWINRAAVLWHLDRSDEALAALDKAIQIDPKSSQALINKGIVLLQLKRYDDAIAVYDKALEISPDAAAAWYGRGTALMKLNRTEEATAAFTHVPS